METGRFWPICPFGARNDQICFEFLLCAVRTRKGRFSVETGRFWPICPFGARNGQICFEFCFEFALCWTEEKAVNGNGPFAGARSALLGPEMVKFALNICYCAVDQEKTVFQWKRAVSGPSALLGPEMVKFALNFCRCV